MVGAEAEKGGIAKNGAKLVTAVACAEVPKFTVVFGASAGAGNYGMWYVPLNHPSYLTPLFYHTNPTKSPSSGRAYSPRFLWTWPSAKTAVMGSTKLSAVMAAVGKSIDPDLKARIERESEAVFSSARLWDDGVIAPAQTRAVVAQGLRAAAGGRGREGETRWGVFRM